jgi:hypothetical protein
VDQRLAGRVGVDEGGDGAKLVEAEDMPEKLGAVLHHQRHHVAGGRAERGVRARVDVHLRRRLGVGELAASVAEKGVARPATRVTLQLLHERLVRGVAVDEGLRQHERPPQRVPRRGEGERRPAIGFCLHRQKFSNTKFSP